jgi:hypothetical protein
MPHRSAAAPARQSKSYSIRQRITDDPDIDPKLADAAEATWRRRIFLRCAEDAWLRWSRSAHNLSLPEPKSRASIVPRVLGVTPRSLHTPTSLRPSIRNEPLSAIIPRRGFAFPHAAVAFVGLSSAAGLPCLRGSASTYCHRKCGPARRPRPA